MRPEKKCACSGALGLGTFLTLTDVGLGLLEKVE